VAAPTGTQQLPQEKYAEELSDLDEGISVLQVLYEKYFLGIDRKPPEQERKRISEKARELRTRSIRNTALKFKVNTLFAKLISFERMWDRTLREMEEGTYRRDVFKAKLHSNRKGLKEVAAVPAPAVHLSDEKLRKLYDTYLVARQRTGESTSGRTFDSGAIRLRAQVPDLMEHHKARNIKFDVVYKGGSGVLKFIPHT